MVVMSDHEDWESGLCAWRRDNSVGISEAVSTARHRVVWFFFWGGEGGIVARVTRSGRNDRLIKIGKIFSTAFMNRIHLESWSESRIVQEKRRCYRLVFGRWTE